MNHCSALLCVGILLLPPQILAATPDPRAEARVRSNNIILLEGDLLGAVRDVQQEVIQSEGVWSAICGLPSTSTGKSAPPGKAMAPIRCGKASWIAMAGAAGSAAAWLLCRWGKRSPSASRSASISAMPPGGSPKRPR